MNEKQTLIRQLHLKSQAIDLLKSEIKLLKVRIAQLESPITQIQLTLPLTFKIEEGHHD